VGEVDLSSLSYYFYNSANSDIELCLGGSEIEVTLDNLQEYIDQMLDSTFNKTVSLQVNAFKKGFNAIFPIEALRNF
jgi:E3 ubiquitin-protein ligase TRIP12